MLSKIQNSIQYLLQLACYRTSLELFLVNYTLTIIKNVTHILGLILDKFGLLSGRICTAIPMTIGKTQFGTFQWNFDLFRSDNDDILFESTIA